MNGHAFIATAKTFEARDKLRSAHAAVETLSSLAVLPGLQPQLAALLAALEGHEAVLEAYARALKEVMWEKPDWTTDEQILKDQLRDVERGIRIHKRGNGPGTIVRHIEALRGHIEADLKLEYAARRARWCVPCPLR